MKSARSICITMVLGSAAAMAIFDIAYESARGTLEGYAAVGQLNGSEARYVLARVIARGDLATMINAAGLAVIVGGVLFLTATRPQRIWRRTARWDASTRIGGIVATLGLASLLSGCGPYKREVIEEIQPNETAFLVPLEGGTANQDRFQSVDYLESRKVAVKRVTLPQRKLKLGRVWTDYKWISTARLIRVDRSPVTREWTRETSTGTSNTNQAIYVESSDSIGFGIGVNITAAVEEPNTAKFLYHYAGKPLEFVIDTNIRGRVGSFLGREFGRWPLEQCRSKKVEIFDQCQDSILKEFAGLGITIRNLGYAEGMVYADADIQKAINETFVVELRKNIASEERKAQEIVNMKEVEMAVAKRQQAEEFAKASEAQKALVDLEIRKTQAQALLTAASRWNGAVPTFLFASGFAQEKGAPNFLMNLPGPAPAMAMAAGK